MFSLLPRTAGLACVHGEISLVCLAHGVRKIRLEAALTLPLPEEINPLAQTAAIRELVTRANCRGWPAAVALPSDRIIRRQIRMATALSPEEREAELREHPEDYLPEIKTHTCMDHAVIHAGRIEDDILLVAARKEDVLETIAMAENAGLVVTIVEDEREAIARARRAQPFQHLPCAPGILLPETVTPALVTALGLALRH